MSCVLGIDLSSFAVDLVRLDETTNHATWTRIQLTGATAFDRLQSLPEAMPGYSWFQDVYLAAIEAPMGRGEAGTQAKLNRVFGAVVARLPRRLELWEVTPGEWRKELGVKGNASKDDCAMRVRELMLDTLPDVQRSDHRRKASLWPQDALDAYAVAFYAREVNQRALEAAA